MTSLTLTRPDDWHLHLRDGDVLAAVLPDTARRFARAMVMPNLDPPVRTVIDARAYRARILEALPAGMSFEPLMTLYLTRPAAAPTSTPRMPRSNSTPRRSSGPTRSTGWRRSPVSMAPISTGCRAIPSASHWDTRAGPCPGSCVSARKQVCRCAAEERSGGGSPNECNPRMKHTARDECANRVHADARSTTLQPQFKFSGGNHLD